MISVGDAVETKRARAGKEALPVKDKDAILSLTIKEDYIDVWKAGPRKVNKPATAESPKKKQPKLFD